MLTIILSINETLAQFYSIAAPTFNRLQEHHLNARTNAEY
jgi:hypothetical protein